jgi:hypothetical protein
MILKARQQRLPKNRAGGKIRGAAIPVHCL